MQQNTKIGIERLKARVKNIPDKPGVYRMMDEKSKIMYIGKAKNLKKRVSSYANINKLTTRIARMVVQIAKIEITITNSEAEAFLLECRLIKENKPPYNILLKDDKSFPFIAIDDRKDFPRIFKYRGEKRKNISYFGPYPSAWAVNNAISSLQKIFLIRPCKDSYFKTRNRPCIEYEIKRCSAPCVGKIDEQTYGNLVRETKDFLNGKTDEIKKTLLAKMQEASDSLEFEIAATYRNRISALSSIQAKQSIYSKNISDADIIAVHIEGGISCIQLLFIRGGKMLGNSEFYPKQTEGLDEAEILEFFLMDFYSDNPPPQEIILSHDIYNKEIITQILQEKAERKVGITFPLKGEKTRLTAMAINNAKENLSIKKAKTETTRKTLTKIQEMFDIKQPIRRIEVFDNSHNFGTKAVGGMIVAGFDDEDKWGFLKKMYRKFNVDAGEKKTGGDDFGMMRQVLTRRYKRVLDEQGAEGFPQLILIDGGLGQLTVATEVFEELGIRDKLNYVAIAKGVDRNAGLEDFYLPDQPPFKLPKNDPTLYFLQNLRDESHRYAITGHRQKRNKDITKSTLDDIPNIGTMRKRALLSYFGSLKEIKEADVQMLAKVEGVSTNIAEKIYKFFR